uniref:Si:ch73-52p7.1 n=1 Tax=Cyprinus carpio TaxID=7962 RepID=A0A8C2DJG2_CYPCA
NCTVHGADLTHISLLVIYALYNCVCDRIQILNLESWNLNTESNLPCVLSCIEFSNCKDQSSVLHRAETPSPLHKKHLRVWYSSPLNVALLLNNSEVQHLSLIQCKPAADQPVPYEYFTVQRLETLTVTYTFGQPGQRLIIGNAPYREEARISVIHTSVLTGKTELKSYTVQAKVDHSGMMPFPNIFMSRNGLSEMSRISVTFLY